MEFKQFKITLLVKYVSLKLQPKLIKGRLNPNYKSSLSGIYSVF